MTDLTRCGSPEKQMVMITKRNKSCEKTAEARHDKIPQKMAEQFSLVVLLRAKMDSNVKKLEIKMNHGFKTEGIQ